MDWLGSSVVVALVTSLALIIEKCLARKWSKKDKKEDKTDQLLKEIKSLKEEVRKELIEVNNKVYEMGRQRDEDKAIETREKIIDYADEIIKDPDARHTKEWWYKATCYCDIYERYTEKHPEFENSQAVMSIKFILSKYEEAFVSGNFWETK